MKGFLNRVSRSGSSVKIGLSWALSATICLTGYYYARSWASDQRIETMRIRQNLNEEFGIEKIRARAAVRDASREE